ncbi:glucose-1-phosphate thymidylyltransferase RfbA [Candidatus Liberibacter sp.]|uniref:glucose-1-phosphate thymidylyltransferase RfbA n=1 Tax=Candidatus Liberibacter sp. TaxID=34022 RepID=UPI0015F48F8F|nr:glucose-1-phosphate thymidylyltransferase RfbA [Candidatus Liberibacter sp.]MBA5723738.1 glucose-1-phosphate thymidylyltransferase RfbA [Candidatus Liberibacter sp.]
MKGIILAGGSGTRLSPITDAVSKQILPIYNKPMIYYPLSILMDANVREILIISTPRDLPVFKNLFGTGKQWGVEFSYIEQPFPGGLAQAYILGSDFVGDLSSILILGDNIFYGSDLSAIFQRGCMRQKGATIVAYHVRDSKRYGVVELDSCNRAISIEEKPEFPKSSLVVTGLYFYDKDVVEIARSLKPSVRGELEITDINRHYMDQGSLSVEVLGQGSAWFDAGTSESLLDASMFVRALEERQGSYIACPEEVAYRKGFINRDHFLKLARGFGDHPYGRYLRGVVEENIGSVSSVLS